MSLPWSRVKSWRFAPYPRYHHNTNVQHFLFQGTVVFRRLENKQMPVVSMSADEVNKARGGFFYIFMQAGGHGMVSMFDAYFKRDAHGDFMVAADPNQPPLDLLIRNSSAYANLEQTPNGLVAKHHIEQGAELMVDFRVV